MATARGGDHLQEMLGLRVGQVNESVQVGCIPKGELSINYAKDALLVKAAITLKPHRRVLWRCHDSEAS